MTTLATSLVSAVGKPTSDRIAKAFPHIRTVGDLMAHYPRRYVPGGELSDLRELEVGEVATVVARVSKAVWVPYKNGNGERFIVTLRDTSGSIDAIFFAKRRVPYWTAAMRPGERVLFAGTVERFGKDGKLQLKAPEFQSLTIRGEGTDEIDPAMLAGPLMPLYHGGGEVAVLVAHAQHPDPSRHALGPRGSAARGAPRPEGLPGSARGPPVDPPP